MTRKSVAQVMSALSVRDEAVVHEEAQEQSTSTEITAPPPESTYSKRFTSRCFGVTLPGRVEDDDFGEAVASVKKLVYTVITAKLLIPGDGDPVEDAGLVTEGKLIVWVGKASEIPEKYIEKARKRYSVPYLMPGLWDVHVHFDAGSEEQEGWPSYLPFISNDPATTGARLARGCWEAIQWGYTSMRDLAGHGCEMVEPIEEGTIVGPNIYSAGACLSQLAGHGDIFSLPVGDVLLNLGVTNVKAGHHNGTTCIIDGVEECRRAVRMQIRRGAKCIKILASGGVGSSDDNPLYAQFSPEELRTIVDESTRMGRSVAAHCHAKESILAAVDAGVTSVEHGSYSDQECVDRIKEKGVVYVATATVVKILNDTGGKGLPSKVWKKAQMIAKDHQKSYELAIKNDLTFALGSDTPPGYPMAQELELAVKSGMTNLQAIKAATANGPLVVKGQAPLSGQLKVGYEADLLGLLENPVEDVKILQKRSNIKWVWKGGKIFKGPGVGPWGEESDAA